MPAATAAGPRTPMGRRPPIDAGDPAAADAVEHDRTLVARVQRGDLNAYGELVRRHMRRAFSIAYGILGHREDAEDVVQEAFMQTLEQIARIDTRRPFHPWLNRVVVNRAISHQRSRRVRATQALRDDTRAGDAAPDVAAEQGELRERLLRALDSLPERQRTIVVLADVEDFDSAEIGEMLAMPPGTVRYHLHLARRALRELLSTSDLEER
jgi:RNA polymerase sigma-70 factor, ECF subfamily